MMKISFHRRSGKIISFSATGHAGFAESGSDIVCAGISSLLQTAVLGLERTIGLECQQKIEPGFLTCMLPEHINEKQRENIDVLLESVLIGLKEIKKVHPKHLIISETKEG